MKRSLSIVCALVVGLAAGFVIRPSDKPVSKIESDRAVPAGADMLKLQQIIAEQSNQISRLKRENATLVDGLSKIVATNAKTPAVSPQLAVSPSSTETSRTDRMSAMSKMIKTTMQQQVEGKIAGMKARLHLTDEQEQVVRELLEKQYALAGEMASKMFGGQSSKEDITAQSKSVPDVDSQLKQILTPQQWSNYQTYQVEERRTQAQMAANVEVMQLQSVLQLDAQQREQVLGVLAQHTEQQLNVTSGGLKMSGDWEQMLNDKAARVNALLTPEQQQRYRTFVESQREMIGNLIGGSKK